MSNVIEFLERMGRDAELRYGGAQALSAAIDSAQLTPEMRAALLSLEPEQVATAVGTKDKLHCLVYPVETDTGR